MKTTLYIQQIKWNSGDWEQVVGIKKLESNGLYTIYNQCERSVDLAIPQFDAEALIIMEAESINRAIEESESKTNELKAKHATLLSYR